MSRPLAGALWPAADVNRHRADVSSGSPADEVVARRLPGTAKMLAVAIGLALVVRAHSIETDSIDQLAFSVVFLSALVAMAVRALSGNSVRALRGAVLFWAILMTLELIQAPIGLVHPDLGGVTSASQVLTDFSVMLLTVLLLVCLDLLIRTREQLLRLILIVVALGVLATFVGWALHTDGVRFEPPPNLAVAAVWVLAVLPLPAGIMSPRLVRLVRAGSMVVVVAMVPVILASRSRTALAVWVVSGSLAIILPGLQRGARLKWFAGGVVLVGIALSTSTVQSALANELPVLLKQARLDTLGSAQSDQSSQARLVEAKDVLTTMRQEGGPLEQILGFGHGATYVPSTDLIAVNFDPQSGRIHNVHMTPVMVFLRYGIVGVMAYAWLFLAFLLGALRDFIRHRDALSAILVVAAPTALLDAMVRNAFADPGFALVLASVAVLPLLRPESQREHS